MCKSLQAAFLEKADAALSRGADIAAMGALRPAAGKGPNMVRTHHRRRLMHLQRNTWRGAIATLGRAVDLDTSIAVHHRRYIEALTRDGRHDEALWAAEMALTIQGDSAALNEQVGEIPLRQNRPEETEAPLRNGIEASGARWRSSRP